MGTVRKRNLLVARIGDRSLHRGWLGDPAARSYDVWLDCFGEDAGRWAGDPARLFHRRGLTKWQGLSALLAENPAALDAYEAIWLPDDDLEIDAPGIERLFEAFHGLGLALAQPALRDGSYFSHEWTLESRRLYARFTNFVEVMAPLFSREALRTCVGTFSESVSGWGLDHVWPRLLGDPRDRIAIVDAAAARHTRPIGNGDWYRALGVSPGEESRRLAARYGISLPYRYRQYGGIPREAGPDRSAAIAGPRFLARLAGGAPATQRLRRRYWSRQLRSAVTGAVVDR